jgi:transposase InsO family protein
MSGHSTIVARGLVGGVRCNDMLIDCGASTCFVRRSWAVTAGLPIAPLKERINVTLADRRTVVSTHEVRVSSMEVHGSKARCTLLVMDELSNEVIVGLDWQRSTNLTITPGEECDLLNGQPVQRRVAAAQATGTSKEMGRPRSEGPIRLMAALVHAMTSSTPQTQTTCAGVVTRTENDRLKRVLSSHPSVFAEELPAKTVEQVERSLQFSIVLVGDMVRPVKQRERRMSPAEIAAATEWVKEEVAAGRMEPSSSEWAAQLVIVPKRNDKGEVSGWRICGDYRNLNDVTKADAEPLPLLQTVFDQLRGMRFFSKLDLLKGFNQIPVERKSREFMAVSTPLGLYQPTVMPFGVKNAPGAFQREMRRVLKDRLNRGVYVFVDDILLYSRTEEEHLELIDWVLSRLEEKGYFAHVGKCEFMRSEVNFLGHVVSREGVSMQQHKVKDVREWPTPQSPTDVRRFLGLAGFYRRFVRDFAGIARPLTDLTRTEVKKRWQWGDREQVAFDTLKRQLTEAPVLAHPDPLKQWSVQTDASGFAIGAVLSQQQEDGAMRPVAYWSTKLKPAEMRYSATERELMAIVKAVQHWRVYLHGSPHPVLLKSDHKPLVYLNGKPELGMRLSRWMEGLSELSFEIGYVKGKDNAAADALSRRSDYERESVESSMPPPTMKVKLIEGSGEKPVSPWQQDGQWMEEEGQRSNQSLSAVTVSTTQSEKKLQVESLLNDMREAAKADEQYQRMLSGEEKHDGLVRLDGLVYSRSGAVYVPNDRRLRTRLLELAHDAGGHFGRARTIDRLGRQCVWVGMTKEVEDYCRSCAVCSASKTSNELPAGTLRPLPIPEGVWDSIGIDFVGPLPKSKEGHDCILVVVDRFSKMAMLRACSVRINAVQTGKLVLDMLLGLGKLPSSIVSDRDVRFTGAVWGQLWAGLGTRLKMSTAYHPQTDGQTERMNRTMQTMLRSYAERREDWAEWLTFVAAAYNSSPQESTKRTPFEMNFPDQRSIDPLQWAIGKKAEGASGRGVSVEAERTLEEMRVIWDEVRVKLVAEQSRQKEIADRRRREVKYEVGDSVWLSTSNLLTHQGKLTDKWIGPYTVQEVMSNGVSVRLDLRGELGKVHPVFHVKLLRPYVVSEYEWPGRQQPNRPAPELVEGETEWEVERIVDKKIEVVQRMVEEVEEERKTRAGRVSRPINAVVRRVRRPVSVVMYRVRWKGWDESYDEWKEESELAHCRQLVEEYELLEQRARGELSESSSAVLELGVATCVECRLTEKAASRQGRPTVRCAFIAVC